MEPYNPFPGPLQEGVLSKRYKRFLADVQMPDGSEITVHCANSGSMLGMNQPGSRVMISRSPNPKRKLPHTLELIWPPHCDGWIGCNTMLPNRIVEHFASQGVLPGIDAGVTLQREVKYGQNSRIDLLAEGPTKTYIEVKNTTLAGPKRAPRNKESLQAPNLTGPNVALFPDAVTARGAKHMAELAAMVEQGHQAMVVFLVNRADCQSFAPASEIDPAYAAAFQRAIEVGVQAVPLAVKPSVEGWELLGVLPLQN